MNLIVGVPTLIFYLISAERAYSYRPLTNLRSTTLSIEELAMLHEDDKNAMIAITESVDNESYEDFYDEMDNWQKVENSMNMLFFGPDDAFMRLDSETVLHLLVYTKRHLIPLNRVLLAWDMITDGKTAAYLQGRELLAFGSLLNFVPEEDLYYVNFADYSVLNYFAKTYVALHNHKFGILVTAYRRYFGNDWYNNATQINVLGWLLCGFPARELAKISPEVFKEISISVLNKLQRCSAEQTRTLYNIATNPLAYGQPYKWSSHEVSRLSALFVVIPEEQISAIQLEAVAAITPEIIRKMNQNKLLYFNKQQVLRLSPKARRIFIIRMQLKNSLDMTQLVRKSMKSGLRPYISIVLLISNLVAVQILGI